MQLLRARRKYKNKALEINCILLIVSERHRLNEDKGKSGREASL